MSIFKVFQKLKEKDKFLHQPKSIPETAKDTYGAIHKNAPKKPEEKKEEKAPDELPGEGEDIPEKFEDKDIEDLEKKDSKEPVSDSVKEPPSLDEESKNVDDEQEPRNDFYKVEEGFFRDFDRFMKNKGLNERFISEILDKDLLHKMKQFHTKRESGTPFFFHREDSDRELGDKLVQLQRLEEEWYIRHRELKEMDVLVLNKEAEIDLRLEELRHILKHIKQREKLERKAKKENYFKLGDGRVVRSIGELRELLKTMDDKLFEYHVSKKKNDFASWVEHVFGEREFASKINTVKSRKELLDVLHNF